MSPLSLRPAPIAAGLALALSCFAATVTPALATPPQAPASTTMDALYAPAASEIPGAPGSVVWWQPMAAADPANVPGAASARRVIYRSTSIAGTPNVASATVFVPAGSPPITGWKVVAWNHVTTGGADLCAPSRANPLLPDGTTANPEFERLTRSDEVITKMLARGLVVVRTDYEGIGTPGPHPYLIGTSLARSTVDAVRATRQLVPWTSSRFVVAGQSEGAIASLWTSALVDSMAPELNLRGTLAATPPVDVKNFVFELGSAVPVGSLSPLASLMLNGARLADPALGVAFPGGILSPEGYARFKHLETKCLAELDAGTSLGGLTFSELFGPTAGAWKSTLYAKLDENDARVVPVGDEPIRFYAGGLDVVAPQSYITKAVDAQTNRGADVSYKTYPLATHVTITDDWFGATDMANWVRDRLQ